MEAAKELAGNKALPSSGSCPLPAPSEQWQGWRQWQQDLCLVQIPAQEVLCYFPPDQQKQFPNAHRFFGVSNILKRQLLHAACRFLKSREPSAAGRSCNQM
ncbi:hypothetical protein EJ110_NYTH00962 [Nymphaea thermarum]|nr:hypothetical protein EJ110_NYTH00962 [Nymphaea thermarum]